MTRNDRAALKLALALALARNESPGRAQQIDSMLEDQPWAEVATFASFCVQGTSLNLMPWDLPPCCASEDDDSKVDAAAVKLLRMMLAAGVSRWHPDPLAALAEAKRKGAA